MAPQSHRISNGSSSACPPASCVFIRRSLLTGAIISEQEYGGGTGSHQNRSEPLVLAMCQRRQNHQRKRLQAVARLTVDDTVSLQIRQAPHYVCQNERIHRSDQPISPQYSPDIRICDLFVHYFSLRRSSQTTNLHAGGASFRCLLLKLCGSAARWWDDCRAAGNLVEPWWKRSQRRSRF